MFRPLLLIFVYVQLFWSAKQCCVKDVSTILKRF